MTAQEIYKTCRQSMPNISLGTVYRNLNILVESGLIRRIRSIDNIDRFDHIDGEKHDHFVCIKCNKIFDVSIPVSIPSNFGENLVTDYELTIKGICKVCKKKGCKNGTNR